MKFSNAVLVVCLWLVPSVLMANWGFVTSARSSASVPSGLFSVQDVVCENGTCQIQNRVAPIRSLTKRLANRVAAPRAVQSVWVEPVWVEPLVSDPVCIQSAPVIVEQTFQEFTPLIYETRATDVVWFQSTRPPLFSRFRNREGIRARIRKRRCNRLCN